MSKRKSKKYILILLIIVVGIFVFFIPNLKKEEVKRKENKKVEEFIKKEDITQELKQEEEVVKEDYIMILEIPKMNLKKGLYSMSSKYNNVSYNIQILKESSMPDEKNSNLILAGHNGNSSVSFFDKLNKLEKEDKVYIYYNNYKYTYEIGNMYEVDKTGTIAIKKIKEENAIVLISCKKYTKDKQLVYIGYLKEQEKY